MSHYTVYEIYDLTHAPTITKRKIAHGGDALDVARELSKGKPYSVSTDGQRAKIIVFGTSVVAYIVAPEGLRG